jgi:uncharacterized protein (DUF1330 family)
MVFAYATRLRGGAVIIAALLIACGAALARGGHGGFGGHVHGGAHAPAAPVYLVIDIAEVTDAGRLNAAIETLTTALNGYAGRLVVDNDHPTALDGPAPVRLLMIAFDDVAKLTAFNGSEERKAFDAARQSSAKSRAYTVEGLPTGVIAAFPAGRSQRIRFDPKPFDDIIKQRDRDLQRMKSICKGC